MFRQFSFDRSPGDRSRIQAKKAERFYSSRLLTIARHIGDLVTAMYEPEDPSATWKITDALNRYAQILEPWARAVGARMLAEVDGHDKRSWRAMAAEMSRLRREELTNTPVGLLTQQRLADQVQLITSLPRDAAERVHKLTLEGLTQGARAKEIAVEIMRSGEVSKTRALLIATTEVSRSSSEFTRARAENAGSETYIWRTSRDGDVRHDHKVLEGKVFRWDAPPIADQRTGARANPGCIYRCRCWPEPVFTSL